MTKGLAFVELGIELYQQLLRQRSLTLQSFSDGARMRRTV